MIALCIVLMCGCREEDVIYIPETVDVARPEYTSVKGFYMLNEGVMGWNKSTLDFYDYSTGKYTRNIYSKANPGVVKEMGDVGNDIQIYGSKMYVVVNCSNKIDVLDRNDAHRLAQVDVPNCRYIRFYRGYAYVSSYVGPVAKADEGGSDKDVFQLGAVFKIDTVTMQVVDTCVVGRQPDEMAIAGGKIYVANSGGYSCGVKAGYETTVSVIDIVSFTEEERIPVAINLQCCMCDNRGILWVSSRGNYYKEGSALYAYDTRKHKMLKKFDMPVNSMWMDGDSLYLISSAWSYVNADYDHNTYKIVDTRTLEVVSDNFITDGTDSNIYLPFGIAVNPVTKDIYVADAWNYVDPGRVYCFGPDGHRKWDVLAGQIPAHFVFLGESSFNDK